MFFSLYFLVTLDLHNFKLELSKCLKENTEFISNDLLLNFREPGLSVLRNAHHIISTYKKFKPSLEKWIEYLCEYVFESFNLSFISDLQKESLFSTFHNLCTEKRHEKYFLSME